MEQHNIKWLSKVVYFYVIGRFFYCNRKKRYGLSITYSVHAHIFSTCTAKTHYMYINKESRLLLLFFIFVTARTCTWSKFEQLLITGSLIQTLEPVWVEFLAKYFAYFKKFNVHHPTDMMNITYMHRMLINFRCKMSYTWLWWNWSYNWVIFSPQKFIWLSKEKSSSSWR